MEIKNIQKNPERKSVVMTIRTTKNGSKFMKDNDISPTLLFNEALKELMKKTKTK